MPLSKEFQAMNKPGICFYCIEDDKEFFVLEHPDEELLISEVLDRVKDCVSSRSCIRCGRTFCSLHASPVDQSDCCASCLPFEDIGEMKTPLVSQNSTGTHIRKGYRVVPTGAGYKTLPKAISDLSDEELDAFILEKQIQIHNIEKQRDYLKVSQSTAKLEKGDREIAVSRALRAIKGIKITGNAGSDIRKANGVVKGVNAPQFDMAGFLKFALDKKKAAAAAKASPSTAVSTGGSAVPAVNSANAPAKSAASSNIAPAAVTAKKEEPVIPALAPPLNIQNEPEVITPAESAREAEIEAMLEGGEPNE